MRVASIQLDIIKNDKVKNLEKISNLIGNESYDLIVLPELFSTGYFYENIEDIKTLAEEVPNGFTTNKLIEIAKEKNTVLAGAILEKEGNSLFICGIAVGPQGFIGKVRKKHLTDDEKLIYTRGEKPLIFDVNGVKIGLIICFEGWIPERTRELAKNGAQVILHTSLICNPKSLEIMSIRALENNCYVIVSNACSTEVFNGNNITFRGESRIFDLRGDVIITAEKNETIISSEIDTSLNKHKFLPDNSDLLNEMNFYKSF